VNAPLNSVYIQGTGGIFDSTFGGSGPSSGNYDTDVYLYDTAAVENNYIFYAGTAGVTTYPTSSFDGNSLIYGNYFYENRYAGTLGGNGGVVTFYNGSAPSLVGYNEINQNSYSAPSGTVNGCPSYAGLPTAGFEIYGNGRYLYNNSVYLAGTGISVGGNDPTSNIYITGNSLESSEIPYYVSSNSYGAIWFQGTYFGYPDPASGVTLDHLRLSYDTPFEVRFDGGVTGSGFVNSHCITTSDSPLVWQYGINYLTYTTPTLGSCP
jgi:hypothetical protein